MSVSSSSPRHSAHSLPLRRLPPAWRILGILLLTGGLLSLLAACDGWRMAERTPTPSVDRRIEVWMISDDLTPVRMVVASDLQPVADGASRVQIIQTADGTVDLAVDPGGIHTHLITDSSRSTIYAIGDDLLAIDAATGEELWRVPAPATRVITMGGFGPSTLALSNNGRWLYVASQRLINPNDIPLWVDVFDATTGEHLASSEELPGCGAARLLPRPEPTNLVITCLDARELHLLTLEPESADSAVLRSTTLTSIATVPYIPGTVIEAVLTPNGEQVLLVSDAAQVVAFEWATQTLAQPVALLPVEDQEQWRLHSAAGTASGLLHVVLTPLERTATGVTRAEDEHSEVRVYAWRTQELLASVALPNHPAHMPLTVSRYEFTVFVVDYLYHPNEGEPYQSRVLEVLPAQGYVEPLVVLEGQNITHLQSLEDPPGDGDMSLPGYP